MRELVKIWRPNSFKSNNDSLLPQLSSLPGSVSRTGTIPSVMGDSLTLPRQHGVGTFGSSRTYPSMPLFQPGSENPRTIHGLRRPLPSSGFTAPIPPSTLGKELKKVAQVASSGNPRTLVPRLAAAGAAFMVGSMLLPNGTHDDSK